MPSLFCQELQWARRLKQGRMRKPSSPTALQADPQAVDGCMWRKGVLALEMAASVLLMGTCSSPCFPFVPVQELLTVIWII